MHQIPNAQAQKHHFITVKYLLNSPDYTFVGKAIQSTHLILTVNLANLRQKFNEITTCKYLVCIPQITYVNFPENIEFLPTNIELDKSTEMYENVGSE